MVELPNDQWLRSPRLPEYAICLDPSNRFYGWMMVENEAHKTWSSVSRLSVIDVERVTLSPDCRSHLPQLNRLLAKLRSE